MGELIGHGANGIVKKAIHKSTKKLFAVKIVKCPDEELV